MIATISMLKKIFLMKFPWNIWINILGLVNFVGSLYFINAFEAQLVLISFLIAILFMGHLYSKYGFSRILGLGHFLWLPMMGILYYKVFTYNHFDHLQYWVISVLIVNSLSLIIDFIDVLKYLSGDTKALN